MRVGAQSSICLFGAGGHGRGIAVQITRVTGQTPVFADENLPLGPSVAGVSVKFERLEDIIGHDLIVTIGVSATRRAVQARAQAAGLSLTSFIAAPDYYFSLAPGPGTVVLSGAVVNAETTLGVGVIINNGAVVEHGCTIGDFTHIAPGAVVAGDVQIGTDCWIGANATVLQGLHITDHVIIGAGALVTTDITIAGTYIGQPARLIPDRPPGSDKQRIAS